MIFSRAGFDATNDLHRLMEARGSTDVRVREAERTYQTTPTPENKRALVQAYDRVGRPADAEQLHYGALADAGRKLAEIARRAHERGGEEPDMRQHWWDTFNQTQDHAWRLNRSLRKLRGQDLEGTDHAHYVSVHRHITNHFPRDVFPAGPEGDRQHRHAILSAWHFRPDEFATGEVYRGLGDQSIYGRGAVDALRHHGYEAKAELAPGTRGHTRISVAG